MPTITLPSGRTVDLDANPLGDTQGIPSNLPANHPAGWDPAYGGAPDIPAPIASAWQALGGDVSMLPGLFSLGNAYNLFNYDQRLGQASGTPGFANVLSNLGGQLPQDVINQIAQQSAERGITSGSPTSPNANAAYLRSLGLNSLDLQKLGQEQYGSLLSRFPQAAPFDIASFLTTPEQQQAANAAANVSAAAPNPKAAADEEQRKLLEAIAAGKAAAGTGPVGSGGIDIQKLIDALKTGQNTGQPGEVVGRSTATGYNTAVPSNYSSLPPPYRSNYTDPGQTGIPGRPDDSIKTAADYVKSIFAPTSYGNYNTQGLGLNPALNATLGALGNTGLQYGGGPTIDNAMANFGGYSGAGALSEGPAWGSDTGNAPNDWLSASDPFAALSNINWLSPDESGNQYLIDPSQLDQYINGNIGLPGQGAFPGGQPWSPNVDTGSNVNDMFGLGDVTSPSNFSDEEWYNYLFGD